METFFEEFQHLRIQLEEIKSATNNFDDKNIIGSGGFGKVYVGELSHFKGRSRVAIKRLDRRFGQGNPEFWKEIMMLSRYIHKNLISLLGFCDQNGEKILIYEHAFNGSLDHHIGSNTLTWTQRLKICLDIARGLSYLHDDKGTQQRVLHRDIKSSNILLDDNWNGKVSDMGLSKIGPANQQHTVLVTNVVGTHGYLDPVYLESGILTKESDVYSFGVVLFEVLCGRLCFENSNGRFPTLVRMWKQKYKHKMLDAIIFQDLMQEMDPMSLETFSDIAFQCLHKSRKARPIMHLVVERLETALELQKIYEEVKHPMNYKKIIKTAVHPLTYQSEEELKLCLYNGILLNNGKTWFSLNKNGEHCEMISAVECLVRTEYHDVFMSVRSSRLPSPDHYRRTHRCRWAFKAHVKAQFLSPQITYTVNLVLRHLGEMPASVNPCYFGIKYRLEGETKCSVSYLTDAREDGCSMAELFQFESEKSNVDLKISFEGIMGSFSFSYLFEGIEFRPVEKVEHEVLEDDELNMQSILESDDTNWEKKLPNDYEILIKWSKDDVKWTSKKELYSILRKGFLMSNGQVWFFIAKSEKRCLMLPAREALVGGQWKWENLSESRFGEVALDPAKHFSITCKIIPQILSPEITYACYLVYKLPERNSDDLLYFEFPLRVKDENFHDENDWEMSHNIRFIYLLSPQTPVIRPKVDQNSHSPLNRPKLKGIPRQRDDGWMEVQVYEFQLSTSTEAKLMRVDLDTIFPKTLKGFTVQGVEFRPE
ncbi:uncharacterized protein LOC143566448 [Bidens hawaiensis]|uniref:uncharacterized protein LOC143566448 n=1 Tax=Bidens hawaiensis TaxID=980011 RepID=UPI00404A229A